MIRGAAPYLLLAILGLAAFSPAFTANYTNWDDPTYVLDNPRVGEMTVPHVAAMFFSRHALSFGLYIPLTELSYALDIALFGRNPAAQHAVNVLLHLGAGLLLYVFLRDFLGRGGAAFFGAAVFLVHPAQVESVAWIAERKSVLSGLFVFAALLAYGRRTRSGPAPFSLSAEWPALLFTLLALLSKPIAVIIPPLLVALDLTREKARWPEGGRPGVDFGGVARAALSRWPYFLLALAASGATVFAHASGDALSIAGRTPSGTLASMLSVIPDYAHLFLFPTSLTAIRILPDPGAISASGVLLGAALLSATLFTMFRLSGRSRIAAFFSVWLVAAFLPVSNLIPIDVFIADRYLYLPLAAMGGGAAYAISGLAGRRGPAWRAAIACLGIALLLFLATLSFDRCRVWRDSETLWTDTIAKSPASGKAQSNLGLLRLEEGNLEAAKGHFREAIRLRGFADAWLNLGIALSRERRHEEALEAFDSARDVSPELPDVAYWRGRMLSALGRFEESEAAYREEIERRPGFAAAWIDLAWVQSRQGRVGEALVSSERALQEDPENAEALLNVGLLRWKVRQDLAGAREALGRCEREASDPALAQQARDYLKRIEIEAHAAPGGSRAIGGGPSGRQTLEDPK